MTNSPPTPDTFASRLAGLRAEAGLSLTELAARAGLDRPHLMRLERGRMPNPGLEVAERIALALDRGLEVWSGLIWPEKTARKKFRKNEDAY